MDSSPVNWETLDSLVLDFAISDHLLLPSPSTSPPHSPPSSSSSLCSSSSPPPASPSRSTSPSSSSYRSRLLIRRARRSLESGDVDAALALLRAHAPAVLHDHRLLFHLQKQRFIELLRRGTEKDREAAMECLRTALAPCALDAYPEAYEEFKHILLVLIFDKDDQSSPVANEWSERRRYDLAGLMSSILRAHRHAYDPVFSMTLRYLISIHKLFCLRQGISSPISDLTERLLFEDRDPPAVPQESSLEAQPFDEVDIQALAHAVELTRQGAVDSLKFAKGDLFQAFQNDLCRMKLDLPLLDKLVHEYCIYRGIVEGDSGIPPGIANSLSAQEKDDDSVKKQATNMETRFACEISNENEDCSTSDVSHQESSHRRLRRSRNYVSRQRQRKRWRGRIEKLENAFGNSISGINKKELLFPVDMDEDTSGEKQDLGGSSNSSYFSDVQDCKYEMVLEMRELAYRGMAAKVVEEINGIDPDFFTDNPLLLFQLKQIEFLNRVGEGDHAEALKVACRHLGPLAASNQALLKPLKETLVALIQPGEDALTKAVPLPVLASSLQVAMSRRLGIEEPQLMKIMRATLHTHTEWFKLQMCKDRFEQFLKIDSLKDVDFPMRSDAISKSLTDECGNASSQVTTCSSSKIPEEGGSPQVSSGEVCDENAILKVMEFLALPRADAIHLLMQYNGNAETVIQHIFS